jgi:N-acyl-D-aspartate/D-glutamate deacylase
MAWGIAGIEPTSAFATAGSLIHPRHYAQGSQAFLKTLSDAKARHERRHEIETTSDWENWYRHVESYRDNVLVAQMPEGGEKRFEGRSIAEIAKMSGKDVWSAFFDLVQSGEVSVNPKSMNESKNSSRCAPRSSAFARSPSPWTSPRPRMLIHARSVRIRVFWRSMFAKTKSSR